MKRAATQREARKISFLELVEICLQENQNIEFFNTTAAQKHLTTAAQKHLTTAAQKHLANCVLNDQSPTERRSNDSECRELVEFLTMLDV